MSGELPVGTGRRPKGPPCKVSGCTNAEVSSGQWTYLPQVFLQTHPDLDKDDCYCHKRPCQRAVGKLPEQQPHGRKRVRSDSTTVSVGLKAADNLTRPPILVSMDEIWAMRCKLAHPLSG
jgi:hypothetical protein